MKKTLSFLAILLAATITLRAQDAPKHEGNTGPQKSAYKLDFKLYELEDGKRTNMREYSIFAIAGASRNESSVGSVKIGTRVPIAYEDKKYSYTNIGFELNCHLVREGQVLWGNFSIEISALALPEQQKLEGVGGNPVLRTLNQNVAVSLTPGKPQLLASIDDLNSKKRTQVEVVATKID